MTESPPAAVQLAMQPRRLRRLPSWLVGQVGLRGTRLTVSTFGSTTVRSDFAVLAALQELGPLSQADLGRRLGMDRSDVVAVLDRLQADDCVERTSDAVDRRRKTVAITVSGQGHLDELERGFNEVQAALLEPLSRNERAQLRMLLERILTSSPAR